jgi:hypothetical protein
MFKNQFLQDLINMQKNGINVFLTEEGFKQLTKLISDDEFLEIEEAI